MRAAAGLYILLLLAAFAPAARAQQRPDVNRQIRDNQERLETIRQERASLEGELQRLRGRIHSISGELDNIEQQKGVTTRIVNELDRQIGSMNAQLDTVTLDLMLAQDALAETRAVLETRLVEIYKRGGLWMFEVMLAAESFGDLVSRYKYLYSDEQSVFYDLDADPDELNNLLLDAEWAAANAERKNGWPA